MDLKRAGYRIAIRKLDAVNYGVAQFRKRIWVWGIRADISADFQWTAKTHAWPLTGGTVNASQDLLFTSTLQRGTTRSVDSGLSTLAIGHGAPAFIGTKQKRSRRSVGEPSPTLATDSRAALDCREIPGLNRKLTPQECLRIQSGPDDFEWPGKISQSAMYSIVGNGWASLMAWKMSCALKAADPESKTVIDLFCGGGLGACGWHGRFWEYKPKEKSY